MLQANASWLKIYTPQVSESSNFLGQAHLSACIRQIVEGFCSFFFGKLKGSIHGLRAIQFSHKSGLQTPPTREIWDFRTNRGYKPLPQEKPGLQPPTREICDN